MKQLADAPPMGANRQKLGLAGHRQGVCSVTPLSGGGGGRIAVRRPSSYKLSSVCPHAAATAAERSFGGHEGEAAAVGSQSSAQHLIFPAGAWLLSWAVAFALAEHFARAWGAEPPAFTVLGFHPSFAAIIALFWVFPTLLMGFGFEAVRDRWLSQERWDDFLEQVHGKDEPGEDDA